MADVTIADLRVLVVDDNVVVRKLIELSLATMGFKGIEVASSSNEAQEKIQSKMATTPYDIVFLDWNMPGKSGYALMQEYREERKYDRIAFVMVTAESQERYVREALKAGATGYITKPITPATFAEKVGKVVQWLGTRPAAAPEGAA